MAPATRGKRAAQSPPTDAETALAKQPWRTNARSKAKVEPVDEDQLDNSEPKEKKPAPRKGRTKAAVKAEPEDEEQDDATETKPAPKKSKVKSAIPKADSAELEDKELAPKNAQGKAKVKDEPAEDENVDSTKPVEDKKKPEIKEAQLAKAGTSHISLDDGCYLSGLHVYVDNDNLIYDASLNQTNASGNNNKFYRHELHQEYAGRVQTHTGIQEPDEPLTAGGQAIRRIAVACARCRRRKIKCSGDPGDGTGCQACRSSRARHDDCNFHRMHSKDLEVMLS